MRSVTAVVAAAGAQRGLAAFVVQNLQPDAVDLLRRRRRRWCSYSLLAHDLVSHGARIQRQSAVIADAAQLGDIVRIELQAHQGQQLRVAVLVDDVDALVPADEIDQLVGERICLQPKIAGRDAVFALQLIAALRAGVVRRAERNEADLRVVGASWISGAGTCLRITSNLCASRSMLLT